MKGKQRKAETWQSIEKEYNVYAMLGPYKTTAQLNHKILAGIHERRLIGPQQPASYQLTSDSSTELIH